ncbi:hypothetical protein PV327_010807 [Microctonus hyperodae]|uniref:Fcf2 pre-rRNA processing C-terminal domain-containing protein n=1 Tax=Microctonus hyperodae TaxID=165561 RepID=A0AA39EY41_MICHY|nr:hypothetical protein PV327_010807 [Microctonus hyperodae]
MLSHDDIDLDEFEKDMGWNSKYKELTEKSEVNTLKTSYLVKDINPIEKIMKKSVIIPGYEQLESIPKYDISQHQKSIINKHERGQTKGQKWYNLPVNEMTPEIRHDLQIIQMRSALDPKHFYKKNDMKTLPKYFHIGKVVDSPIDYYNGRLTKKEKKKTIVDELMADAEFCKYNKRKYREIINCNKRGHSKAHSRARKLSGKKN